MRGIVAVAVLAKQDLFAALGNDADGWLSQAMNGLERDRTVGQMYPWEEFFFPFFVCRPPDALHQFLTVGLLHHGLAFSPLVISSVHGYFFSCCFLISLARFAESSNHSRQSFYHPGLQRVYTILRQSTCCSTWTA